MRAQVVAKFRKCALLCAILGAHILLLQHMSLSGTPHSVRRPEEAPGILLWIDLPEPSDSKAPISIYDPHLKSGATRDNSITQPPEIGEIDAPIDWDAEAKRVASDAARDMGEEKVFRSLDQHPPGMGPLPPKPSRHKAGDSVHLEGGVVIDWINHRCYYSSQDAPIAAFGPALRLQTPTCTGAGGASKDSLPSLEEWKKEQANR